MFAQNLKYLRTSHGLDQKEFADRINRSVSTVSEWESGKYTPKAGILADIANMFNVQLDSMMNEDLSSADNTHLIKSTVTIMNQLHADRQQSVHDYAQHQLDSQDQLEDQSAPDLLAAHLDDENMTDDERQQVNDFLRKIRNDKTE